MSRIVTFGEIMMRLNPEGYLRIPQAERLMVSYAGGEANVSVSLAGYGEDAAFVSKVPAHAVGQSAVNALRRYGVDTKELLRGGDRLGIYFVEKGASQRPSKVIYDRAFSALAQADPAEFEWARILEGCDWFHFTGITPALGGQTARMCMEACEAAKAAGATVSCDLNYRVNLWSREQARETMTRLMAYVDLCIANEEDAADVFGICAPDSDICGGKLSREGYEHVAKTLTDIFGFQKVAITLRGSITANDNNWSAMMYDGGKAFYSKEYRMHLVDRVGGGDSFGGGLIYALLNGYAPQQAIEFAVAASCLKHSIEYDFNLVTVDEVHKLMQGDGSGRVQR